MTASGSAVLVRQRRALPAAREQRLGVAVELLAAGEAIGGEAVGVVDGEDPVGVLVLLRARIPVHRPSLLLFVARTVARAQACPSHPRERGDAGAVGAPWDLRYRCRRVASSCRTAPPRTVSSSTIESTLRPPQIAEGITVPTQPSARNTIGVSPSSTVSPE